MLLSRIPTLSRSPQLLRPFASSSSLGKMSSSTAASPVPGYLLHAPFLSLERPHDPAHKPQLLQRTLPPSPLYYTVSPPKVPPGSAPPILTLLDAPPVQGTSSTVYRAQSPSGAKVVLKYSTDFLALMHEADEVYVNLPARVGLPIPTFWGIFEGKIEEEQQKALVMVLEDCGEPVEGGFEALTQEERQKLYDSLDAFHSIHFQHGSFSPSSLVGPSASSASSSESATAAPRKITMTGFSKAEWHLCPGAASCKELVEARKALSIAEPVVEAAKAES
ncbi:hypothetical protein JCM8097_001601 [Rhodosporidiobolus ruineniae]